MGWTWVAFTAAGLIIGFNAGFIAHSLWTAKRMRHIEITGALFLGAAACYQDDMCLRSAAQKFAQALGDGQWQSYPSTNWAA